MKNKRLFAWILVFAMALSMMPVNTVRAEGESATYTVKMPKGFDVILCDRDGNVSGEATPVNQFDIAKDSTVWFKVEGNTKYSFSAEGATFEYNYKLNNTAYCVDNITKEGDDRTINVTGKKLCKFSAVTSNSERCFVALEQYNSDGTRNENVVWLADYPDPGQYFAVENSSFVFTVRIDDYDNSVVTDSMTVKIGDKTFETPVPENGTRTRTYYYTFNEGVSDDFTVVVDGVYRKSSLTVDTSIPRNNIVLKDSNGTEIQAVDPPMNIRSRFWDDIIEGGEYKLEISNVSKDDIRIVDRSGNTLTPVSTEGKLIYDVKNIQKLYIGKNDEFKLDWDIDRDISGIYYVQNYNPDGVSVPLNGFYSTDSKGNIYFWIGKHEIDNSDPDNPESENTESEIPDPVIYIKDLDGNKIDVTISKTKEMKKVTAGDGMAYVYMVPCKQDMMIYLASTGDDGNKIVETTVEPEVTKGEEDKKPDSGNNDPGNNNTGNNNSGTTTNTDSNNQSGTTETPAPQTPAPEVPAVGTTVEATYSKASFTVIDKGTADSKPEVVYTKPEKSEAKVTIPSKIKDANGVEYEVTAIDSDAFKNDKKLTQVTIPATVDTIGNNAFSGCKNLTTVKLGKNVETIGQNAFANCTKLKKVEVTGSVTKIGKGAFSGCKSLKTITIKSTKITKIDKNAFKGIDKNATIKVPKKQKKAYAKMLKKAGFKGKIK